MKNAILLFALLGGVALTGPANAEDAQTKGQAELAKLLEGRVAGEPQSCVPTYSNTRFNIIDRTAIVVDRGSTIYVNVPHDPETLDDNDALKIRRTSSQLCRTDLITSFDRMGGFFTGNVMLTDFIPYKKVES